MLQGSGQLQGSVIFTGANTLVSPGYSIGQLNVQGTYQQTGGNLALEIGRTAAGAGGTTRDVLTSTGALNLTGTALTFSLLAGSLPLQLGYAFTALTSTTNALTLAGDSFTFDASLAAYTISQTQTPGGYTLTIVPEPTTFAMLAASALGLSGVRRRKSSR